jgi:hypothetical protein
MNSRQLGANLGILAAAALCGASAAAKPTWFVAVALVSAAVVLPLARIAWKLSVPTLIAAMLVAIHFSYVMRHTWFDVDYVPAFKYIRFPLLMVLPAAALLGGLPKIVRSPVRTPAAIALIYTVWILVVGQWGPDPGRTLFYGSWLLLLIINVATAVALSDDPRELWGLFLKGLSWLGVLSCLASLIAIWTGAEIAHSDRWISGVQRSAYRGVFFNPNVMGAQGIVTLAAPLAYRVLFRDRKQFWMPGILALSGVVVLASASRGCFIGYSLGLTIYLFEGQARLELRRRAPIVVGLALAAVLAASGTDVASSALDRMTGTASSVGTGDEGRVHIWKTYLNHTLEHPIVGVGFSNSALQGDYVAMRSAKRAHSPHSALVQYLVAPGIPAGLLFTWLLVVVGRRFSAWRKEPLRASVLMFWIILSPLFLGSTVTGPRDWGALLLWLPLMIIGALPTKPEKDAGPRTSQGATGL